MGDEAGAGIVSEQGWRIRGEGDALAGREEAEGDGVAPPSGHVEARAGELQSEVLQM